MTTIHICYGGIFVGSKQCNGTKLLSPLSYLFQFEKKENEEKKIEVKIQGKKN
jgi:hypothetical protein